MPHFSKNLLETNSIAKNFLDTLEAGKHATVVALEGDLGSGKTTFVQGVGKILGIEDRMQSPTFVIEKIYAIKFKNFRHLIHIDAYRLEKDYELLHLGWQELILEPENLIFIEWPERVSQIIPKSARRISFKFIDEKTREINYEN